MLRIDRCSVQRHKLDRKLLMGWAKRDCLCWRYCGVWDRPCEGCGWSRGLCHAHWSCCADRLRTYVRRTLTVLFMNSLIETSASAIHGSYMANVYDFYKPNLSSEYPVVDGPLTITTYLEALDQSYARYREKTEHSANQPHLSDSKDQPQQLLSESFAYSILHSPYCRLVQKGHARLVSSLPGLNTYLHKRSVLICAYSPSASKAVQRLPKEPHPSPILHHPSSRQRSHPLPLTRIISHRQNYRKDLPRTRSRLIRAHRNPLSRLRAALREHVHRFPLRRYRLTPLQC